MTKIIPTWGYRSDGSAKIFDLEEGEILPDGWSDRPELWHHPNTAHLYTRPISGDVLAGGGVETHTLSSSDLPPHPNEPEADDEPPVKPRRGRPPKSEPT
jgi:hypothetical protein